MTDASLAAVLWDMDGTVIDSEPLWLAAETEMLDRYGIGMTEEVHRSLIGSGLTAAATLFQRLGVPLTIAQILREWTDRVGRGIDDGQVEWRPGARQLLRSLRAAGIPCALVTMSLRAFAERVVRLLPEGSFQAVVTGDEVIHEKPHPDPYIRGAAALGVPIERCLAIEDSPTGLRSARSAGAVTIGVPNLLELPAGLAHEQWATLEGVGAAEVADRFARLRGAQPASIDLRP